MAAVLPPIYIYSLARNAGFNDADAITMTAIALSESGGNTDAGDTQRGGVFMTLGGKGKAAQAQAADALGIKNTTGWTAWESYRNKTYLAKMADATLGRTQFYKAVSESTGTLPPGMTKETAVAAALSGLAGFGDVLGGGLSSAVGTAGDVLATAIPAAVEGLTDAVALGNIGNVLSAIYDFIRWFTNPSHLWRVAKFFIGVAMIFLGGMSIIKDTPVGKAAMSLGGPVGKVAAIAT